jgi:hypothetical protein
VRCCRLQSPLLLHQILPRVVAVIGSCSDEALFLIGTLGREPDTSSFVDPYRESSWGIAREESRSSYVDTAMVVCFRERNMNRVLSLEHSVTSF